MSEILHALHFLRPDWFYAFIPLVLFIAYTARSKRISRSWQSACDPDLLPHVLGEARFQRNLWPLLLVFIASSLSIIALAGPVYKRLPQPVYRETSSLVIALDLSRSMDATDVQPSRLERAKLKLLDLLKTRDAGQTALIVYAATPFTVTPLTDDTGTIANMVPTLQTSLMPAQGSDASKAINKAVQLLHQAGVEKGDILLMTDGIKPADLATIKALPAKGIRLSILGFGTTRGAPIPTQNGFLLDSKGNIVIPKLNPQLQESAARLGDGLYLNMQDDRSDIKRLARFFNSRHADMHTETTSLKADIWREEGPWLLLLVIPLAAFGARRGWLASLVCLLFVMQMAPRPAYAESFLDKLKLDSQFLWQTPDQKAAEALKNGDAKTAAKLFQNPAWKAAAQYRAGDYAAAAKDLDTAKNSNAFYNRGNALAQMKKYQDAIKAYDQALKLNPNNSDAKYNRKIVEKALQQQQQKQNQSNNQNKQQNNQKNNKQNNEQNKQNSSGKNNENQKQQQDQNKSASNNSGNNKKQNQNQQSSGQQNKNQQNKQSGEKNNQSQNQKQNQQQNQNSGEQKNQSQQQNQQQNEKQGPQKQQSQSSEQQNQNNQQQQKQSASETEKNKDNLTGEQKQKPAEQQKSQQQAAAANSENLKTQENDKAAQQWLRRIPDDPGGLLRRKFLYQYSQLPNQVEDKQPW